MKKSSERIEEEIDGIRDRMRHRIDSATREFSPKALAVRATGKKDPSAAEVLDWAVGKARANPIATALVAIGLLGLATQSNERTRMVHRRDVEGGMRSARGYAKNAGDTARGYAHDAADVAVEKADDALHYARETAGSAGRAVSRRAHDAEVAARHAAERSAEYGREGADWVKRNPTSTGLFALALGAAAASVFAARRREDYLLEYFGADEEPEQAPRRKPTARKRTPAKKSASTASRSRAAATSTAGGARKKSATAKKPAAPRKSAGSSGAQATAAKARATRATKPRTPKTATSRSETARPEPKKPEPVKPEAATRPGSDQPRIQPSPTSNAGTSSPNSPVGNASGSTMPPTRSSSDTQVH